MTRITHQYRYRKPGAKRWKMTRHHMELAFAKEWFAQFHPDAIYEPVEHTAIDIDKPYTGWNGPNNHGGWRPE